MKMAMPMMGVALILSVLGAWTLGLFLKWASGGAPVTVLDGALVGFLAFIGFFMPPTVAMLMFEGRKGELWAINLGHHLVATVVMGAILGAMI